MAEQHLVHGATHSETHDHPFWWPYTTNQSLWQQRQQRTTVENIDKIPGVCGFVLPKDLGMEQAENLPDSTTEHAGRLEHAENNQQAGKDKVPGRGAEHPPCPQIPPAEQVILYKEAKKKTAEQQPQELAFAFVQNTKNTQDRSAKRKKEHCSDCCITTVIFL